MVIELMEQRGQGDGQRGFGAHLVRCGTDRGIPRLLCTRGEGTFSTRQGGVLAASARSIRIPSVTGWIEPGGLVRPRRPICSIPCISPSANRHLRQGTRIALANWLDHLDATTLR